jgi:hypothetical protein
MKFAFFLGGLLGFGLVAGAGWVAGREPGRLLRDAALGCVAGAFLLRWFWSVLARSLVEVAAERRRAANQAAAASSAETPSPAQP